jgi:intein/homing endonuclease
VKLLSNIKYKNINHNYFKDWNPSMAYILGWIYSDGCLDKERSVIRITVQLSDKDILEFIQKELCGGGIYIYQNRVDFVITSKELFNDLLAIGLHPCKSLTITFPSIPKEYKRDFIRGVFDGDGSIIDFGSSLKFQITSGSSDFINGLCSNILMSANVSLSIVSKGKNTKCINAQCHGTNVLTLYEFLYYPNCVSLKRKYSKYTELYNHYLYLRDYSRKDGWRKEEIDAIKKYYQSNGAEYIKKLFPQRTNKAIRQKAKRLGIKRFGVVG